MATEPEAHCGSKADQLRALLLLVSETSHEAFCLMDEGSQKSLLSLAYELSLHRD